MREERGRREVRGMRGKEKVCLLVGEMCGEWETGWCHNSGGDWSMCVLRGGRSKLCCSYDLLDYTEKRHPSLLCSVGKDEISSQVLG